ncbi:MAG TPA: multiheme c-type cytochrome [Blastocatellia bacterium]|nr:multiheme c-type cytochrome [Blastocatellia bacterium]
MNQRSIQSQACGASEEPRGFSLIRAIKCVAVIGLALLVPFFTHGAASAEKKDSCVECHSQMADAAPAIAAPVEQMKGDVHSSHGFSCVDCHGGDAGADDMTEAMSRAKGFVGKPEPKAVPAFCGKCHSNAEQMKKFAPALRIDQEREYRTSVHGKLLEQGDRNVATCISCHGSHGVRAVNDPLSAVYPLNVAETCSKCHANADYMKSYNIEHDQYEKYKSSVHAKALYEKQDLSAPTCNDCHGNHGAAPPGIASVSNVCGQCHARQSTLFAQSPHKAAFDAVGFGECIECHSNHDIAQPSDEMIGVGEKSVCILCHDAREDNKGYVAARQMRARMDELAASIKSASDILTKAERAGMEVSRPKFELNEARDALTHARVLIHSFSTDEVEKVIKPGLDIAAKGESAGLAALDEWSYRRKGLAASLFFILFLAALVYLKVRQIENKQRGSNG